YGAAGTLKLTDLENYTARLAGVKKVKVSLIMDACHAGFDVRKDGVLKAQENISAGFNQINKLLGCAVNEFSYEADSVGHGLFSWYLVQGLMGLADAPADNIVTFDELKNWTQKKVAAATRGKQNPIISAQNGDAVFAEVDPAMRAAALALAKNKSYSNLLAMRGTGEGDTLISAKLQRYIDRYNRFLLAGQLYEGDSSALGIIYSLDHLENTATADIKSGLQNHLAEALETRSQLVLNEYLKGKSEQPPAATYLRAGMDADLADSLLAAGDPRKKNDRVMANFHKAFSFIRYENFEKYGEAERLLREALAIEDRAAYLYVTMSYLMEYQNKYDSAIYFAQKAERIIPTWTVPKNILGNLYADIYQWEKSLAYHQAVLKMDSSFIWSYNNLGKAMLDMDRIPEAEAYFQKALTMKKNSKTERLNSDWAIAYSNLGVIYKERGLVAKAEYYFNIADSIDPTFTQSKRMLSDIYAAIDGEKAGLYLEKAIIASPFEAENYYKLAELNRRYPLNKLSLRMADSLYRKAITLNPYNEWYHAGLGYLYVDEKDSVAAAARFKEAVQVSRSSPDALYNLAYYHAMQENADTAVLLYRMALAKNPHDISIADEFAELLLKLHDTSQAEKVMLTSASLQQLSPKAAYVLGNFYYKIQNSSKALSAYKRSITVDPNYVTALKALMYTHLLKGNVSESKQYLVKLNKLDRDPQYEIDFLNAVAEAAINVPLNRRAAWLRQFYSIAGERELLQELIAESLYESGAALGTALPALRKVERKLDYSSPALIKWLFLFSVEGNDKAMINEMAQRYLDELLNTEPAIYAVAMKITGKTKEAKKLKQAVPVSQLKYFRQHFKRLFSEI
ncbi:MAG: tetratricopeptide repeat protein, partial [Chitinophagaceae bacterium]